MIINDSRDIATFTPEIFHNIWTICFVLFTPGLLTAIFNGPPWAACVGWWPYTHACRNRLLFAKRQRRIFILHVGCANIHGPSIILSLDHYNKKALYRCISVKRSCLQHPQPAMQFSTLKFPEKFCHNVIYAIIDWVHRKIRKQCIVGYPLTCPIVCKLRECTTVYGALR